MSARGGGTAVAVALLAALLVGCAAPAAEREDPPASPTTPTAEPTTTTTPTPRAAVFRMPSRCSELLPAARVTHLESLGMELLAGPEGKYGDDYLADPTPEQLAGGITCIWGEEEVPENSVIVSVAPVADATRAAVIEDLVEQGLNERVDGEALIYERIGDEVAAPAIVNAVHEDCWVSVIEGLGGQEFYEEAAEIVDEVEAQVGA